MYYIGDLQFRTKALCKQYAKQKIDALKGLDIYPDHEDYEFLHDLIQNHDEYHRKVGSGIKHFTIRGNLNNHSELMIFRTDGSDTVISWDYCTRFRSRTHLENISSAMRNAVSDHIISFKRNAISNSDLICALCNNVCALEYHVDHFNPSFVVLRNKFLSNNGYPLLFTSCPHTNMTIFKDEDIAFRNKWISYHNENCNLQILCAKCNLTKTKKGT